MTQRIINQLAFAIREEQITTEEARELRAYLTSEEGYALPTDEYLFQYDRLQHMETKLLTLQSNIITLTEQMEEVA